MLLLFCKLSNNIKIKIYTTIILPVFLYGSGDTRPLTLVEEHRLWVFENRVLRGIFGPKRDDVTGERKELHNEELNDLYSPNSYYSGDRIEKNEKGWACGTYGRQERCIQGSSGET